MKRTRRLCTRGYGETLPPLEQIETVKKALLAQPEVCALPDVAAHIAKIEKRRFGYRHLLDALKDFIEYAEDHGVWLRPCFPALHIINAEKDLNIDLEVLLKIPKDAALRQMRSKFLDVPELRSIPYMQRLLDDLVDDPVMHIFPIGMLNCVHTHALLFGAIVVAM